MLRHFFLSLFFLLCLVVLPARLWAQKDSTLKGVQISLLTCGVGPEIYSVFGHTAVRIVDSTEHTDIVYNYGTFDGYDKDFEMKFMKGKLLYYLSEDQYADFIQWYGSDGRWVREQVIACNNEDKRLIQSFLLDNMLPGNRTYKYDFFFDNCATRIRDIFTQSFGEHFSYPNVLPKGSRITFRDIINRYLAQNVWERLGINILLGSKIDQPMSNAEIMFLPDYLSDAVDGATLNGKAFAKKPVMLVEGMAQPMTKDYSVLLVLYGLMLITILGLLAPKLHLLGAFLSNFFLLITGLLGVLILIMWLSTDHQSCRDNFNLLWALPTNLMFLFKKKQYKYAFLAIILLFVSLLLHLLRVQELLLPEMIPVLITLLFVFGVQYRKYKNKSPEYANAADKNIQQDL